MIIRAGAERSQVDVACREHLAFVRKNCPDLLPAAPLEAGATAPGLPIDTEQASVLVTVAAQQAAATSSGRPGDESPRAVVWRLGADSLLVLLDAISVQAGDGVITVAVDVACDELRSGGEERARIELVFVVGTEQRPAGLLVAATPTRGPDFIVGRWGDALVALAWQALLDCATGLTAGAGTDMDGSGLIPAAWTASREGIMVFPQARHPTDRRARTAVQR
jgi:hypothetical protein